VRLAWTAVTAALVAAAVSMAAAAAPARGDGVVTAAVCGTTHWVGAWAADPSGTLGGGFADQTLRVILTPHIGGSQLRVHFSNRYGPKPVTFTRASVALRQTGAALVAGSSRPLSFAGQPGVTVPAGGDVVSDPAPMTFAAFQDLAVSLYLADPTGPATGHFVGRERSYATARSGGDHTADEAAGAFVASTATVIYLDAVDALAPAEVGAAVLFGDSVIDGYESSGPSGAEEQGGIDLNHRFPDYLARRLAAQPGGPRLSVLNAGISGNRLLVDAHQTGGGASGLNRLDADAAGVAGATDAIVLEGINDIGGQASVEQVTGALAEIVVRLHARGLRVLLGTITPAGTGLLNVGSLLLPVYVGTPGNLVRLAVNSWIRNGATGADGFVDFDAALRAAALPNQLDPRYDSGDHVHPNYLGYSRMAENVDLSALRGAQCGPRLPTKLRVGARDRSRRLRVSGSLLTTATAACAGASVTVRALRGPHTILKRRLPVTPACHFAATRPSMARGRIEVRVSFAGSPTLLPTHARSVFLEAG
jgi:lysophospholipase L1-like esterase